MTANELVENVTGFEFERMGYLSGMLNVSVKLEDGKKVLRTDGCLGFKDYGTGERTVTQEEWNGFFTRLFSDCGVMDYPREFKPEDMLILDGEHWKMRIEFRNRRAKNITGDNTYPENWKELIKTIDMIAKA